MLDKERPLFAQTLESLRSSDTTDPNFPDCLAEINLAIGSNDFRAVNICAGYLQVTSNKGAFGDGVV